MGLWVWRRRLLCARIVSPYREKKKKILSQIFPSLKNWQIYGKQFFSFDDDEFRLGRTRFSKSAYGQMGVARERKIKKFVHWPTTQKKRILQRRKK